MDIQQASKQLKQYDLWKALPEAAREMIFKSPALRRVPRHHVLFHAGERGDTVWVIVSGMVKVSSQIEEQKNVLLYLCKSGDLLGDHLLNTDVSGGAYMHRATTFTDCIILGVDPALFANIIQLNPAFEWTFVQYLLQRIGYMEKRLAHYRFNRTKQRIGSFLKELATHEGQILLNGEILIPLYLTHEMIAEIVAVSRQLVTVTLNQWSKAGIVRYKRQRLTVIKPEML